jgi:type II secretory ATPase GspE/PulE/Tfp pilus assembly ATPase PilB-like protein
VYKKQDIGRIAPGAEKVLTGRTTRLYEGKGCQECGGIGYRGRIGIFELIPVSQNIRTLILKRPSAQQVWAAARAGGTTSMFEDGIEKARQGITTLEEVSRVASAAS